MRLAAVGSAFPPHFHSQDDLVALLRQQWSRRHYNLDRLEQLHRNVRVGGRHLALPAADYARLSTWGARNDAWIEVAQEVGGRALLQALERSGLGRTELEAIYFVTVTGIATPSIDARLINRLGLSPQLKRLPIFGLGCVAGAAGIARAAEYVRAFPRGAAALLSVELCSLTMQFEDLSIPNLIASGLFGDGAACAIVLGEESARRLGCQGPEVVATRSIFYPDSERVMGWDISERGFQIVLSAEVPEVVRRHLRRDVDSFLADHGLDRSAIASWVCHPGGPKVLEAIEEALAIDRSALALTWRSLEAVGNLSSTSVLLVLEETMRPAVRPAPGAWGVLLALGPGFCSELVLLRW